jgi:hypothetical protein
MVYHMKCNFLKLHGGLGATARRDLIFRACLSMIIKSQQRTSARRHHWKLKSGQPSQVSPGPEKRPLICCLYEGDALERKAEASRSNSFLHTHQRKFLSASGAENRRASTAQPAALGFWSLNLHIVGEGGAPVAKWHNLHRNHMLELAVRSFQPHRSTIAEGMRLPIHSMNCSCSVQQVTEVRLAVPISLSHSSHPTLRKNLKTHKRIINPKALL